jgi:ATP-binding cassette subfamily F protein 3
VNPHKLAKAESRVGELEQRIAAIDRALAAPDAYADGGVRAAELGREQADLRTRLAAAEAELLALYDAA